MKKTDKISWETPKLVRLGPNGTTKGQGADCEGGSAATQYCAPGPSAVTCKGGGAAPIT